MCGPMNNVRRCKKNKEFFFYVEMFYLFPLLHTSFFICVFLNIFNYSYLKNVIVSDIYNNFQCQMWRREKKSLKGMKMLLKYEIFLRVLK